jgi:urease accessory protein UreF
MDAIAAATGLAPEVVTAIAAVIGGALLYLLQRIWTNCPLLPWLEAQDSTGKKRIVALLLAAVAAWIGGQGDWQKALVLFLGAFTASQATFTLTPKPGGDDK